MRRRIPASLLFIFLLPLAVGNAAHRHGYADVITFGSRPALSTAISSASENQLVPESSLGTNRQDSNEGMPRPRYLPLTCLAVSRGSGDTVMSLDQGACLASSSDDHEVRRAGRLPSPYELAWLAADRAMWVAKWPQLQIAPSRVGLTGLRSYFWLRRAPEPVVASASIPGLIVTAEAHPVRYEWSFGEGPGRSTLHPGRAWTKRRPGNVGHMYERRGRYRVSVDVVWEARWRMGAGAWRHLGYFSNADSRTYSVRQMVAMLSRRR